MVGEPDHDDRLNEGYQKEQVVSPLTTCKGNTVRIGGNGKYKEKMMYKHINPFKTALPYIMAHTRESR